MLPFLYTQIVPDTVVYYPAMYAYKKNRYRPILFYTTVSVLFQGFSEYVDVSHIADHCVREMILVNLGYRLVENYIYAKSPDEKTLQINVLQKIYEMGDI